MFHQKHALEHPDFLRLSACKSWGLGVPDGLCKINMKLRTVQGLLFRAKVCTFVSLTREMVDRARIVVS